MSKTDKSYQHWLLQTDPDHILWLFLNRADSSVNTINQAVLNELSDIIENVSSRSDLQGIIIGSAKKSGIAGADITQFKNAGSPGKVLQLIHQGQATFTQIEQLKIPTLAIIEGFCLGGGLELALACQYRIAESSLKTKIGLPEIRLGIQPGWKGSVRLPELINPLIAMEAIVSGRTFTAVEAKKMGIVDAILPKRLLEKAAKAIILDPPPKRVNRFKFLNTPWIRKGLSELLTMRVRRKVNPLHYPAPFKVIENWKKEGIGPGAAEQEAKSISELVASSTAQNLVRVFFLQEKLKELAKGIDYLPHHIHVVGAGVMGGDIAAWCAVRGFKVTLQDQTPALIGSAIKRANQLAAKQLKEKHLIQAVMDRLVGDPHGMGISKAEIIIEAISENVQAKQELFAAIEKLAKKEAILATNTSTIPLEEIGANMADPHRVIGIHFFNPVAKMQLVEIVYDSTTPSTFIEKALAFVRKIDRLPLPVKSGPGFLVNRILFPYMIEAFILLEEGVRAEVIDQAAVDFGMPMGPIELADAVGLDICAAAIRQITTDESGRVLKKLKEYISQGKLGRKSGGGFYQYKKGKLIKAKRIEKTAIPEDMTHRLVLRMLNEAVSCLREKVADSADQLDAGCIFGFGFPPFRGGPIHTIHSLGQDHCLQLLQAFTERYGERFTPDVGWRNVLL